MAQAAHDAHEAQQLNELVASLTGQWYTAEAAAGASTSSGNALETGPLDSDLHDMVASIEATLSQQQPQQQQQPPQPLGTPPVFDFSQPRDGESDSDHEARCRKWHAELTMWLMPALVKATAGIRPTREEMQEMREKVSCVVPRSLAGAAPAGLDEHLDALVWAMVGDAEQIDDVEALAQRVGELARQMQLGLGRAEAHGTALELRQRLNSLDSTPDDDGTLRT